jgi:Fe-S-cluster containining protein
MESLGSILVAYRSLLGEVDAWFEQALRGAGPGEIACARGCSACCRGLFDITLLDAFLLQAACNRLPPGVRREVLARAEQRRNELRQRWPGFVGPYLLNAMPDSEWTEMPEDDLTPCPLLGEAGTCLVYASRPLTCRLHGLPNIDISGESFADEWCTLNFTGSNPLAEPALRWTFRAAFARELALFREFTRSLTGTPHSEFDTFIPTALLINFPGTDWNNLEIVDPRPKELLLSITQKGA